ncbi:MAG: hypothetical protein ACK5V9_03070 [Burkholderiales bacterium]
MDGHPQKSACALKGGQDALVKTQVLRAGKVMAVGTDVHLIRGADLNLTSECQMNMPLKERRNQVVKLVKP